ncbi:MAG: thymidine kinase [Candidatus Caccovivens sp.]
MAKLYFKYGVMGSSKTASALMCRFNYLQKGFNVLLMKPKIDIRFSNNEVVSRIGLSAPCYTFSNDEDLVDFFEKENALHKIDVIIVDECQFCTKRQIEQLRSLTENVPVLCYGLMTNFKGELFEGSKRLVEICDSLSEIKSVCACGRKATMNAKFVNGLISTTGQEIDLGADEKYRGLCYPCFKKEQRKAEVYNKIIKYIKIFKSKEDAGQWSTDTSHDNIVLEKPFVLYDEDVKNFIEDFKDFAVKNPDLDIQTNLESLKDIKLTDKDFDYLISLISLVLKTEKTKPGLLKSLIEEGVLVKWLKAIKKLVDNQE